MKNKDWIGWLAIAIVALPVILLLLIEAVDGVTSNNRLATPPPPQQREIEIAVSVVVDPEPENVPEPPDPVAPEKTAPAPSSADNPPVVQEADKAIPEDNGELPPISANYRNHVGFSRYVAAMTRLGARFFIMDGNAGKIAEIDFRNNRLTATNIKSLQTQDFSPRSRTISDEPALSPYLRLAKDNHGISQPEVFMLVPADFDRRITAALQKHGMPRGISALKGFYTLDVDGSLKLHLDEAVSVNGIEKISVTMKF